jgi:hypothetical protein
MLISAAVPARARRTGNLAVELLLVIPVLLAVLLAVVELSQLVAATQRLDAACAQGARVAAQGGDEEEVEQAVHRCLESESYQQVEVESVLRDRSGRPLPSGAEVKVRCSLRAADAAPDLLCWIGFGLRDEKLSAQTVMRKE